MKSTTRVLQNNYCEKQISVIPNKVEISVQTQQRHKTWQLNRSLTSKLLYFSNKYFFPVIAILLEKLIQYQITRKRNYIRNSFILFSFLFNLRKPRYIKVKVDSPPKNKLDRLMNKFLFVFYLTQPSSKQIICFDFEKNSALPLVF